MIFRILSHRNSRSHLLVYKFLVKNDRATCDHSFLENKLIAIGSEFSSIMLLLKTGTLRIMLIQVMLISKLWLKEGLVICIFLLEKIPMN